MWFLQRMLLTSWTAKKSNETVLRETDTRSLITRICKRQASFFWPCDVKRATRTFGDKWND